MARYGFCHSTLYLNETSFLIIVFQQVEYGFIIDEFHLFFVKTAKKNYFLNIAHASICNAPTEVHAHGKQWAYILTKFSKFRR